MANAANSFIPSTCPDGCEDFLPLPPAVACRKPSSDLIDMIFFANVGHPFADVTDVAEWNQRISTASTAVPADAVRALKVYKGEKPAVTPTVAKTNWGGQIVFPSDRTITFVDQDSSLETREFYRELGGCGKDYLIWFRVGGILHGGNEGILAHFTASESITNTTDSPTKAWNVTVTWEADAEEPATEAVY